MTERNFVDRVIRPHLGRYKVFAKHQGLDGGLTWGRLNRELNLVLAQRRAHEWATTMLDLYKVMSVPDMPLIHAGRSGVDKALELEKAMARGLSNPNFIPYVQVHEFETLVFVDLNKLSVAFPDGEAKSAIPMLQSDIGALAPEDIDEGEQTAPSKRLIRRIPAYQLRKSTAGPEIAKHIGLEAIRRDCPHFNDWITKLERLGS